MGERSTKYVSNEPIKIDVRSLPKLKEAIIRHIDSIFDDDKDFMPKMGDKDFRTITLAHIDDELKWIAETLDPVALHYVIQEYHLDVSEWEFWEKENSYDYWDGFLVLKDIPLKELVELCNERNIFSEPIDYKDLIDIFCLNGFGCREGKLKVIAIPDIALIMDSLSVYGYICANWAEVAGHNQTFLSKNGKPISAESYRTALHQWHDREKNYRNSKDPNKTYLRLKELDEALTKLLH